MHGCETQKRNYYGCAIDVVLVLRHFCLPNVHHLRYLHGTCATTLERRGSTVVSTSACHAGGRVLAQRWAVWSIPN